MAHMSNYRVWAPYATEARLLLGDPENPKTVEMHRVTDEGYAADSGWFEADVARSLGDRYAFSLRAHAGYGAPADDADDEEAANGDAESVVKPKVGDWTIPLPDPRSQSQPDGPHGFSEVVDLAKYDWQDGDWTGRILPGGLIYEMHIGTYSEDGTFAGAIERLDHLVELGVTHVEIMPVQPFGGDRNWGYDGVSWHAVHEGYGGPRGLQQLIDACHNKGLAVILDVVYNHFGPDGNYVGFFGPYTSGGSTGWGEVVNLTGDDSDEVRSYILDAISQWFVDYHVDGLRLDAVHALHDEGAFHILEQMQVVADSIASETGIPRTLIAESDQNDPRLVRPRAAGGFGLNAQWDDDVHHALHTVVSGENHAYYSDFGTVAVLADTLEKGFYHLGKMSTFRGRTHGRNFDLTVQPMNAFVTYTTTHDQTGNRAIGDRPSMNLTAAQQVLKAAVIACSPFTPMLFQGEEWGASTPFAFFCSHESEELQRLTREGRLREFARAGWDPEEVADPSDPQTFYDSKLNWSEAYEGEHVAILASYRHLFALRRAHRALRTPWADSVSTVVDPDGRWLAMSRHAVEREIGAAGLANNDAIALVANFSDQPVEVTAAEAGLDGASKNRAGLGGSLKLEATFAGAPAELNENAEGATTISLPAWGFAIMSGK